MLLGGATFYLVIVLYVAIVLSGVYFCIFADPEESSIALLLTETLPEKCWSLSRRYLPKKLFHVLETLADRSLQLFYLAIFAGGTSITVFYIFPLTDEYPHRVSPNQKIIFIALVLLTWWSWRKASTTSPGIITARSLHRYDHYPYDDLLFVQGTRCATRGIIRPARSKFDRHKYNENVPRFDHYCGWINNTVGEENYRFFLLFVFINEVICIYGTYMISKLFYGIILDKNLFNAYFVDRNTGEEFPVSKWLIFQYLFDRYTIQMGLYMLVTVMGVALGYFLLYHAYLTSRNMTTNESFKWDQVRKWYKAELQLYNDAVLRGEVVIGPDGKQSGGATSTSEFSTKRKQQASPTDGEKQSESSSADATEPSTDPEAEIVRHPGPEPKTNIYDRGFVENWKEVLVPLSLRKASGDARDTSAPIKAKVT